MKIRRRPLLALVAGLSGSSGLLAQSKPAIPLLIEGKKTLFQKVLTRPGAQLAAKPGVTGGKPINPFTVFFVYGRTQVGVTGWLEVGASSTGRIDGFIEESATTAWRHMITLAFSPPTSRERVLFFKERAGAAALINSADAGRETARILQELKDKKNLDISHPVIATEPDRYVDLQKSFYLLPVLEASSVMLKSGHRARVVKVASVTAESGPATAPEGNEAGIANYNAAVVFVIDATSSMQPYIDLTRKAVEAVLKQAEDSKLTERIRFGLVAFQDDPKKTKGMDYLSRVFADPQTVRTREEFLTAVQALKATANSTRAFAEDGYAGLDDALRKINWRPFGGRYVVYISDASVREGDSPLASTQLRTPQIRAIARDLGVALYALHLKTPEGKADHLQAEAQLRRLTEWPGRGPLYYPIEAGDAAQFDQGIKQLSQQLVEQVKSPRTVLQGPAQGKGEGLRQSVDMVGRAMILAYLGRQQGVKSPPMYEAWAVDRDVRNRDVPSFTVRVLLTKNQLSDLQALVRRLADAYERSQLDPANFFNQLRSAAATMGRDPSRLGQSQVRNLEQAGLMAEYLDGLPYQSPLMSMSFDAWKNMSVGQQQALVDNLRSLAALYQRFHDDSDRWVALNPAASEGEKAYPVPIDSLP